MTPSPQLEIRQLGDVTVLRFLQPHLTGLSEIEELGKRLHQLDNESNSGESR